VPFAATTHSSCCPLTSVSPSRDGSRRLAWRKRVGIEPTVPGFTPAPDGFEGRAGHQTRLASNANAGSLARHTNGSLAAGRRGSAWESNPHRPAMNTEATQCVALQSSGCCSSRCARLRGPAAPAPYGFEGRAGHQTRLASNANAGSVARPLASDGGRRRHAGAWACEARIPTRRLRHSVRAEPSGGARPLIFLIKAMRPAASHARRASRRRPAGSDPPRLEAFFIDPPPLTPPHMRGRGNHSRVAPRPDGASRPAASASPQPAGGPGGRDAAPFRPRARSGARFTRAKRRGGPWGTRRSAGRSATGCERSPIHLGGASGGLGDATQRRSGHGRGAERDSLARSGGGLGDATQRRPISYGLRAQPNSLGRSERGAWGTRRSVPQLNKDARRRA